MCIHPGTPGRAGKAALFLAGLGILVIAGAGRAQQPDSALPLPRLNTVFPCGGKAGTTVDVTFTGTDLEQPERLIFSHPALKADPIVPPGPPADPKKPPPPKPPITSFRVTIPANQPPGHYDVRLVNKWGVSNARTFVVGDLAEVLEKEPNNDVPQAQRITLNATVNGNMASAVDVDYFVFTGKKGQRVVFSCLGSSIDSRLDPNLEVYDTRDRLLAKSRNYNGDNALCDLVLPADGDYLVRISEFTHTAGNQEYFYRLSVSTAPWIDAIFPPVIEPGKTAQVTVHGRNLPGGQLDPTAVIDDSVLEKVTVSIKAPDAGALATLNFSGQITPMMSGLDGFEFRLKNGTGSSNPFLITFARAPVVLETEGNDKSDKAQAVTVPCEIAGRVDKRGDRDWFTFVGKKGETLTFELVSDRIGSPGDMYFILRNPANKQTIVEMDDDPLSQQPGGPLGPKFFSRTDDPGTYRFTVPADGPYQLLVSSRTDGLSGPRSLYRMRIGTEQPDFRLIVLGPDNYRQSSCCVRQGGHQQYRVLVWRQDGFNGAVTLNAEGLPRGVTCPPQVLGAGLRQTVLVVSAAGDAPDWNGDIKIKGTATIGGKSVVREGRPGNILWQGIPQPGFPRAGRIERSLALAVRDKAPWSLTATIDKAEVAHGQNAVITIKVNRQFPGLNQPILVQANAQTQGQPSFLPPNFNLQTNIAANQNEVKLTLNVNTNFQPGTYNIVFRSQCQVNQFSRDPRNPKAPKQNIFVVQPSSPVSLTVVPKTLATVSVGVPQPNVKAGAQAEIQVRVARQYNYDGEFKVKLELPANSGLTAEEATVLAGQNEAKVVVKVAAGAAPGGRPNLTAKVTALFNGKTPIVQEAKFNLNVVK